MLWYDLKKEAKGWKVQYVCLPPEGCGQEFTPGRISSEEVADENEAYRQAERIGERLY